ncbi:MAG TPA: hypothetical protein VGO69_02600 [Pyrinomonadaceae bacterium]|jgi:hypothetical protein|nr:hypothetical protein [Pyrinomonadaceae bacterium]
MKRKLLVIVLLVCTAHAQAQLRAPRKVVHAPSTAQAQATGQQLPIRRVILYSNGVAYIERRGMVSGHAEVDLSFKQSQVDDVLKSMIVLDLGRGRIGAVSYNSSAPPSARMADIPFSIDSQTEGNTGGGLAGVLSQLQGARVAVTTARGTVAGKILTVEERKAQLDANKPPQVTHALVTASDTGELSSFDLAEVRSVKLIDEGTRRDVSEFADASASARRRDAKTIVVTSDGAGQREMMVSYTIAAPIWKTTYRVVLDAAGKPFFQGWAIVDNVSDEDWENVQLSLVSGTPVSFIQPIQKPFYRYRPVVPIPDDLKLDPQVYEPGEGRNSGGGDASTGGGSGSANGQFSNMPTQRTVQSLYSVAPSVQRSGLRDNNQSNLPSGGVNITVESDAEQTSVSTAMTSENSGVEAAATGSEVGDLFEYRIDQPVTVRRDRSALIPILQTRMEGERVSIYNEAARRDRPLSGMLLKNSSPLTLEDGSMTVIDGDAYAGEALMERLKPSEQRLISFALDLGTLVTVRAKEDRAPTFLVKVVNSVFQAHYYQTTQKLYTLKNQTDRPRVVYIEHPVREGWNLTKDTREPDGKSARFYRFRIPLEPGQKVELPVTEQRALMDTYALANFTRADLELFIARSYINQPTRAALEKLIDLKSRISATDARLEAIDKEIAQIGADQSRLRDNIKALTGTAEAKQLIARYVSKADEQETRLEQLNKDRQAQTQERLRLQGELETSIRTLSIE